MNLPFFIARRYLLRQKGAFSSFIIRLAILATALSVATMIVAVAFISGFKYEIREKLFSFWGHVMISPLGPNASDLIGSSPIFLDEGLKEKVSELNHVKQIAPYVLRPAIIHTDELMEGIQLKGINSQFNFSNGINFTGGNINFSDSSYSKDILLSQTTASRLELKTGDEIQLYFLEPGSTLPRIRKVKVAGLFHTGMEEVDKVFGICDMRLLQRINNWAPDQINGYQVDLDNAAYMDSISAEIFNNYIEHPVTTHTIKEIYPNIFDWLELQDVNGQVIIIIMAIVAIINLAVALMILIVEQARMIGVLKAQGMTQGSMQQIFLYHAGLIAGCGILLGNIIAIGICLLQQQTGFLKLSEATYYMQQVPVRLHWWYIVVIDIATLLLCILCMWLPTLYIRRIQPAKVLQFK